MTEPLPPRMSPEAYARRVHHVPVRADQRVNQRVNRQVNRQVNQNLNQRRVSAA